MDSAQQELIYWFFDLLSKEMMNGEELKKKKVIDFLPPHDLADQLQLKLNCAPKSMESFKQLLTQCVAFGARTYHPHFYNQLYCPPMVTAMLGALYNARLDCPMNLLDTKTLHNTMEESIFQHLLSYIDWPQGSAIFTPGGSMGNFYAVLLAREKSFPGVIQQGLPKGVKPRLYCSQLSHYSVTKSLIFLGMGTACAVPVPCDADGGMKADDLKRLIESDKEMGFHPFLVIATAGTTVFGAFDYLPPIADVCEEFNLHLHVDGCLGGSCLLVGDLRHHMTGLNRADSFTWNPHKSMGVCLQASIIFSKDTEAFRNKHFLVEREMLADKLSLKNGEKLTYSIFGDHRPVNIFKLWMNWMWLGSEGYAHYMDKKYRLTSYIAEQILLRSEEFQLITKPQSFNVCFYYIPAAMRAQERTDEWWKKLNLIPAKAKGLIVFDGSLMLAYQQQGQLPVFFRMVCNQYHNSEADMDFVLNTVAHYSELAYRQLF